MTRKNKTKRRVHTLKRRANRLKRKSPTHMTDREVYQDLAMRAQETWGFDENAALYLVWCSMLNVRRGNHAFPSEMWEEMASIATDPAREADRAEMRQIVSASTIH